MLVVAIVGLFTVDFGDDNNVATGPGGTTTTEFPGTTATTAGTATTQPSSATTQGTTATTSAPATTQATTATTTAVGGTATTAPGSGLGTGGTGQAGQGPLATSGGTDMMVPAILLALVGIFGWRVSRRGAPAER
ncbi:MAG: hypothetical protein QOE35_1781 [Actinomycetota bacterium]|jgi:hypothetical protein